MTKYFVAVTLGALIAAGTAASCKCNKGEDTPPPPSAPPAPSPPPTLEMAEEDAGADAAGDADADAKKIGTGTYDPTRLMACCNALAQNAKSAPITQQPFMLQAAAACKAAVAGGQSATALNELKKFGIACK